MAVHIYSTSTSRLLRTLHFGPKNRVVGYKLCPVSEDHVYVFTSGGISKWEWATGRRIAHWETSCRKLAVDLTSTSTEDSSCPISFSLGEHKGGKREILVMSLANNRPLERVVFESTKRITNLRVALEGQIIVAWDSNKLFIGNGNAHSSGFSDSVQYVWREVSLPVNLTCVDIRESTHRAGFRELKTRRRLEEIDIVLGESGGSILVLHNALRFLFNSEDSSRTEAISAFRRLHWHRGPVHAVRWSKDGKSASLERELTV